MKRFLLLFSFFTISHISNSQITWDGGGDGLSWSDAQNWVGNVAPVSTDDVLLDNSIVLVGYSVFLPSGTVSTTLNTLTITGNVTVYLPNSNSSSSGLQINGTGDAFVINDGATFINSSGASSGTPVSVTTTNFFRINNGGRYIHNTERGHTNNLVARLSSVAGTENGVFVFDVPGAGSYFVSASGRIYGTLIFSGSASGGLRTYLSTGISALTINGVFKLDNTTKYTYSIINNFIVNQDVFISSSCILDLSDGANNTSLFVKGYIINDGVIEETGAGNLVAIELNGTANQPISGTGSIQNMITFIINNAAGATLNDPLILPYNLTLSNGKINTSSTDLLTMIDNATYSGGSTSSFIHGPLKKIGDDNFIFPVGKGSIYAPIGIVNVSGETATDQFTAEYLRTNPQSVHGILYDVGMDHISFVEYWTLNQNLGSAVKKVSEYVSQYSFCKNLARTYVSRWNGLLWTNEGSTNGGITPFPPLETGTITSVNNLSAFGDFTLITDLLEIQNPLPVFLKDVNAVKNNNDVLVTWELTACCSKDAKFEVERSIDKNTFTTIATVNGSETNRFYSVKDYSVNKGITYYRLKITDYDGKTFFSKIVVILNGNYDLILISISPSIVQSSAILNIALSKKDMLEFAVTDMNGKAWMKKQIKVESGNNSVEFSFDKLSAGVYHLSVFGKNGFIKTIRFVKQ